MTRPITFWPPFDHKAEAERQLAYIAGELARDDREASDVAMLKDRRAAILRANRKGNATGGVE